MKAIYLFVLLFLPFLISCSTYEQLSIDVLMPAKYTFQPEIKSIVLVDNARAYREKNTHKIAVPSGAYSIDTIWKDDFPDIFLYGLKYELDQRNFFDSVYVHEISLRRSGLSDTTFLTWSMVNELCKKYDAQAVVSIDDYIYQTNIKVEDLYDGNMYGYLDASSSVLYRGYNNLNKSLIFSKVSSDTISWSVYGNGLSYVAQNLPNLRQGLADLANYMGDKAVNDIAPFWETEKRILYSSGNFYFMQAAEHVRNDNWGEAIKLWKYVFDNSKKLIKSRAAYNLALASEVEGDYKSASYWIKEGLDIVSELSSGHAKAEKKRLILYSLYMNQRLEVVEELKIQVGGGE
ncbi:DUF6340 family protein [Plebeiibacterium sediminum]|uniref:DUF6340 family protein n=1 Tax=Plebeiibacterium sediminum TaxID=2992112 RepID=A0AAE3M567_9BACT|nr:DUF6340 family protein [Plebeiobacterium sediminum]MCW3787074.1 DUF6340 family protein [Plebeiobacterium sediminum]